MSRPSLSRPVSEVWAEPQDETAKPKRQLVNLPGGNKAVAAFFLSLVAYTFQTEFAQYVQQSLGYRKPFLSLYLGHSGFMLLFPMHLSYLCWSTRYPLSHYLHLIAQNLKWQMRTPAASLPNPRNDAVRRRLSSVSGRGVEWSNVDVEAPSRVRLSTHWIEDTIGFNAFKLFGLLAILTIGITVPALSWYSAVPMTSMADITAIYNTFSVWALVFSVWFLGEKWEKRKVFSVLLACFGVVIVAYGGAEHRKQPKELDPVYGKPPPGQEAPEGIVARALVMTVRELFIRDDDKPRAFTNPILGDVLAFVGAVTMAAYEMAFKLIGTLPDEEKQGELYSAVNRRSRSYIEYRRSMSGDMIQQEEEGLLADGEPQHVIGDDTEEGERVAIWKQPLQGELESLQYQTMTPPPEPAASNASSPSTEDLKASSSKKAANGVRVQSLPASEDEEDATESELEDGEEEQVLQGATRLQRTKSSLSMRTSQDRPRPTAKSIQLDTGIPPPLPFGLHANIMTSGIGFVTFTCLWIGIPIAHYLQWEPFELPPNLWTVFSIFVVVFCGIFFNAAFMILLSMWGPVLASVSCLMTTILVEIADVLLGHRLKLVSVVGCTLIAAGFGVLVSGGGIH